MLLMKLPTLYLLLLFCALLSQARADCQLSVQLIKSTNRIFAILQNGNYYPLRKDIVGTGQTLELMCDTQDVQQIICQADGTFSIPQAINSCSKAPKVSVDAVVDAVVDDICYSPYKMYRMGYNMKNNQFLEIYRSCYDVSTATANFSIHDTYHGSLARPRPKLDFSSDRILTGAVTAAYAGKQYYPRFVQLFGATQNYVTSATGSIIHRGHLAPSADFIFPQERSATFMYLNAVPQFSFFNLLNIKTIEDWVRRQAVNFDHLRVCTGGYNVLQLPDTAGVLKPVYLYLSPNGVLKIPIPEWLYKIVKDPNGNRVAFLTYHNNYVAQAPAPPCSRQVACPTTFSNSYTVCCDANDFISRYMPKLANVC